MTGSWVKIDKWAKKGKVSKICNIIKDKNAGNITRMYAVEQLAKMNGEKGAEALLDCLGSELFRYEIDFRDKLKPEEAQYYNAVIKSLGNFPTAKVILALLKIIYFSRYYHLLDATMEALLKITGNPFNLLSAEYVRNDCQGREGAAFFLCRIIDANTYYVHGEREIRLNYKADERVIQMLLADLEDEAGNSAYKEAMIKILGSMKEKRVLPHIIRHMSKAENKRMLVEEIGHTADQSSVTDQNLMKVLMDLFASEEDTYLKNEIINALGRMQSMQAVDFLMSCMRNRDHKSAAVKALGRIRSRESIDSLAELARNGNETAYDRSTAIEALGIMKAGEHIGLIVSLLEDKELRCACVKALGALGGEQAVKKLADVFLETEKEYLHDTHQEHIGSLSLFFDHSHLLAAKALGDLGASEALPMLREALPRETDLAYIGGYPFDRLCKCKIVSEAIQKITGAFEKPALYDKAIGMLKETRLYKE